MGTRKDRQMLIRILRAAHAGELGAAFAYRGHWKAVTAPDEIVGIRKIEAEEWAHRQVVGAMLQELGAKPLALREAVLGVAGRIIGALCHVTGWFFPMYIAGRMEKVNVHEYADAALLAKRLGLEAMRHELLRMMETEKDHELFFMRKVVGHPLLPVTRWILRWGPEPIAAKPKEAAHKVPA